jgi:hypothetical protein
MRNCKILSNYAWESIPYSNVVTKIKELIDIKKNDVPYRKTKPYNIFCENEMKKE